MKLYVYIYPKNLIIFLFFWHYESHFPPQLSFTVMQNYFLKEQIKYSFSITVFLLYNNYTNLMGITI